MSLQLIYPNIPFWRAEVSRLALHLGGVHFENVHPSREEFRKMKESGSLPFGQVPVLVVDGSTIAQTGAIARFCGKLSGHYPTDPLQAAMVDQYLDAATDVTTKVSPTMRIKDPGEKLAAREHLASSVLPTWFGYLETMVKNTRKEYLVGDTLTIADLAIWRLVEWLTSGLLDGIPSSVGDAFPELTAHRDFIANLPEIRDWMEQNYGGSPA